MVVEVLIECGGVASRADLIRRTSRSEVDAALRRGDIVAVARGRYALASADEALQAAALLSGVVSHESAALLWGWGVKFNPDRPHITVPSNRNARPEHAQVHLHRVDLHRDEVCDVRTTQARTLVDCLRSLPFDAALAVADSALREGFMPQSLAVLARDARGPGACQIRRVAATANGDAANPFESVLRSICLRVDGLQVRAQVPIWADRFLGRPDLVDEELRIVIEADSFEWHGGRAALRRDAIRYNAFLVHGWLVLRFCWEDVMHHAAEVAEVLLAAVRLRQRRSAR